MERRNMPEEIKELRRAAAKRDWTEGELLSRAKLKARPRLLEIKDRCEKLLKYNGERLSGETIHAIQQVIACMQREVDKT